MEKSSANVIKRLQNDLMDLTLDPCHGISAFPENDDLLNWIATISGPDGTAYAGRTYKLALRFSSDYPFHAPAVRFKTPIFHPNVDVGGKICLDILDTKWSAVYNVKTLLLSIQSLLEEPNEHSPLNGEAARLWSNRTAYMQLVAEKTPGEAN